jgi:hypothetical protein
VAGRIRSIKPEILEDAKTAGLDDHAWRLFVSLWMLADDYGGFHCHNERQVHGSVFWGTETTPADTSAALARLSRDSLVTLYEVRGQRYGKITNWEKHQRVDHPGKPRVPQMTDPEAVVIRIGRGAVHGTSRDSRETLAPDPDPDLRSPTSDPDHAAAAASGVGGQAIAVQEPKPRVMALALVEPASGDWRDDAIDAAYEHYPRKRPRWRMRSPTSHARPASAFGSTAMNSSPP